MKLAIHSNDHPSNRRKSRLRAEPYSQFDSGLNFSGHPWSRFPPRYPGQHDLLGKSRLRVCAIHAAGLAELADVLRVLEEERGCRDQVLHSQVRLNTKAHREGV